MKDLRKKVEEWYAAALKAADSIYSVLVETFHDDEDVWYSVQIDKRQNCVYLSFYLTLRQSSSLEKYFTSRRREIYLDSDKETLDEFIEHVFSEIIDFSDQLEKAREMSLNN